MKWMKLILIISLSQVLNGTALQAQCVSGDCENGKGIYVYPSGARLVGSFLNHLAQGFGILHFANGDIYEGDWVNHVREGNGKFTSKGNFVYEGEFKKNKFHGSGRIDFPNGHAYVGNFEEGTFHGTGKYTSDSGEIVEGQWVDGEPVNRKVKLWGVDKNKESSDKKEDVQSDQITDCNQQHCHYEVGRFMYEDGTVYTGMFVQGQPDGRGRVDYQNGDVYIGAWKNHAPHGEGVVQYINGRAYGAIWEDGRPVKELSADHNLIKETVKVDRDDQTKIWAVIIGVSRYNHMPTLKYTDDDAFHLYAFLKSPEGGAIPDDQISLLIDEQANRNDIVRQLQQTFYRADENDVVLLYFSGHGLQGRMIPSDFDGYNNAVKYDEIRNIVEQSRAKHKIVIADACHSGSLLTARNSLSFQLSGFYQQLSDAQDGIAFITSSKGEEVSLESTGLRQGIFSHYLIRGLRGQADLNQDLTISITELYQYIDEQVRSYTNNSQHPLIFGNYDPTMPIAFVRE